METINYTQQGMDFLKKYGIKFTATRTAKNNCPKWKKGKCDDHAHGNEYQITLSRNQKKVAFQFWNSLNDRQNGINPSAYDVLACISSDVNCPETFEDFCSEYGYNEDSRKAFDTFKRCRSLAERLQAFLNTEEIEALQEIQ